ncbi:polysaccharide biosynthesis protein [Zooshikella ganghwensis]|uniref:Polysaccharide biosynthesis protein n=1 Tax=Zooshikella ganghwensis TaxID=202772 RepID=A0A4P9VIV6_9GAMM|nr:nucleoside-diphosphate sugar epimerase/dehydratase [Zooshikella ganghwensis]RDH43165.1 polysaccharide biosynthesis protein [Zooshikella ganghwensis]
MQISTFLINLSKRQKRILAVINDVLLIWAALWSSFYIRLGDETIIDTLVYTHLWLFLAAPVISLPVYIRFGLYRAVLRYLGKDAFVAIFKAVSFSGLAFSFVAFYLKDYMLIPRSIIINYWALSLLFVGGVRYIIRIWLSPYLHKDIIQLDIKSKIKKPVAIYGAGQAGFELLGALERGSQLKAVAFIDNDRSIANRLIGGIKVYTPKHIVQMINETGAKEILLAMPSLARSEKKSILSRLQNIPIHIRSVPSISELATGKVKVQDVREIEIADILGRDVVKPNEKLLANCINNKIVLVTGAGGSIGSELCRQIINLKPSLLVLYDSSEFNLYSIYNELVSAKLMASEQIVSILGSVLDFDHVVRVLNKYKIETIYHAAAYKHVPMVEHNINVGFKNNVIGTKNLALAAITAGVKKFVLISTDKAVRPTNVMGATKRIAELILQALSDEDSISVNSNGILKNCVNETCFTMVRFGNVLGSSGSVIPLFRKQLSMGGPITVTHPDITRYFMTIPEASQLVIQASSMSRGGEVFVLDMGEPVKINNLAIKMVKLSGLTIKSEDNKNGEIEIIYTGLRPGEKLYEELLIGDNIMPTDHPMILKASEHKLAWDDLSNIIEEINMLMKSSKTSEALKLINNIVPGYKAGAIVDYLHNEFAKTNSSATIASKETKVY